MTRVLPLPAPARMSTGPSVVCTASCCCGFKSFDKSIFGKSAEANWSDSFGVIRSIRGLELFYRNAFSQISRLIDIASAPYRAMIGEQLKWNDFQYRKEIFTRRGQANEMVRALDQIGFVLVADRNDNSIAGFDLFNV